MNLQHERLLHLCTELRLDGVAADYPAAAQKAAEGEASFTDFLETVLRSELDTRRARARTACLEALGEGVHSADVIINILARRRQPEPPITISTPEALRLRHAPAADCTRYDSLRRIH